MNTTKAFKKTSVVLGATTIGAKQAGVWLDVTVLPFTCSTYNITGVSEYQLESEEKSGAVTIPIATYNSSEFMESDNVRCPIDSFELVASKTNPVDTPEDFFAFNDKGDI